MPGLCYNIVEKTGTMLRIQGNEIYLYGTIGWELEGVEVVRALADLSQRYADIILRLHTLGGLVVDGNLIYNAIGQCPARVTIQVDGISASMGSILMLAASRRVAADNAMFMIHAPSGYAQGNAVDMEIAAQLLRGYESSFRTALLRVTSADEATVDGWLDGTDHWFTAAQALELHLIDEIREPVAQFTAQAKPTDNASSRTLFEQFTAALGTPAPHNQSDIVMKDVLSTLGLPEGASEAEAVAAIGKMQAEVDEIRTSQITDLVTAAIDSRLIGEDRRDHFIALGKQVGPVSLKATFDAMHPAVKPIDLVRTGKPSASASEASRTWGQYSDEELLEMRTNDRERYTALYEAEFKIKPVF